MNKLVRILPLAALLLASPVAAQGEAELKEEEHAKELREAEAELAEAAQRVAELSMRNLPDVQMAEEMVMSLKSGRPRMGITIATNKPEFGPVEGSEIVGVTPGSAAAEGGLRSGDVITSINGEHL